VKSSPTRAELVSWRAFLETAYALIDILDDEMRAACGFSLGWYDALVHLEDATEGLRMNDLAGRLLLSNSGLTRVIDRMEEEGLVDRERPEDNRRVVLVHLTPAGRQALGAARAMHRRGLQEHFVEHVDPDWLAALGPSLDRVRAHARGLRPGRIST
jgi:DNA-binding MarR family transcriptional regulator